MILKAEHLSKTYNDSCILNDVSIEINEGEIVAITGPSGAGKTTLLNLLSGLDVPDINASAAGPAHATREASEGAYNCNAMQ